ncbi:MAG: metallopeptidase family protein [Planctomycetes bacterium]|nr:metallopeptidase family protein [Planctomycetota bacterium]
MTNYDIEDDEDLGPEDEILDRAWDALDREEHEEALAILSELDPDWPERWIPEALARIELGDLRKAHKLIEHAREIADDDHPDLLWARAQLALREWRLEEAEQLLQKLLAVESSPGVLERLALLADLRGDFEGADRRLGEAHAADPRFPIPPRLDHDAFEAVVDEAIQLLPKDFQAPLETTEIVIEPVPAEWMIDRSDPAETPPDLLGLFVGSSEIEKTELSEDLLPRRIYLFQRNLERAAHDRAELVQEIRVTLYHEIGHMLGFDEDGVAEMGLE